MATGMREKTTNVGGVIKRIWYAMTGATQGAELASIDDTGKFKCVSEQITGLAGTGQRGIVAAADGSLGTTGVDFIFSTSRLTSTPQSTGININGGSNGKIVMAYLSGQWDSGNGTSAALIMIRCGYDGNNFSATVISSDKYTYPVSFTQTAGILYVSAAVAQGVRIRFIIN